ncbi:MAG: hypothetical protein E7435_00575 [Ruminococcaceae bacterium]|nr:hypothetical protein [Oscillospiraceae bacterium]
MKRTMKALLLVVLMALVLTVATGCWPSNAVPAAPTECAHIYEAVVTAPTCTEDGYTTYTCVCGDSYKQEDAEATGHISWTKGETVAPTCYEEGYTVYHCVCGLTENRNFVEVAEPLVQIGETNYSSLEAAVAAAKAGDTITLVEDVALTETLTLPAGIIFNGNGKNINGTISAGGDLTFAGYTKVTSFSAGFSGSVITIGEGATLEITGTSRITFGYGNTFNIIGSVDNAKTADKETIQPSLIIPGGVSITGSKGVTVNVTNAYVKIGNTSSKNSVADGTFKLNFTNAIAEFTNQFTLSAPTSGKNPTFEMNVKDSVLTTATKLCIAAPNSTVVIDNSNVALGSYLRNSGDLTLKNGAVFTGAMIQFGENGGNDGTITVDASSLTIKNSSAAHAMDGNNVGKLILQNGATASVDYIIETILVKDTTSTLITNSTGLGERPYIADGVIGSTDGKTYYITNVAGLTWLAETVNGGNTFAGKTVVLEKDLDLAGMEWTPIGTSSNAFKGTFDGSGKTISNLKINGGSNSNIGLFGVTQNGEIKNLTVNNAPVSGRLNVGVVAGQPYTSKYTNIIVTGHIEVNGMTYVGGVGGKNAYADWTNITVAVDAASYVKAYSIENGNAYRTYVGGVVGFMGEGGHTVSNAASNVDVFGSTCDVGGIVGIAHYGNKFVDITCSGNVTVTAAAEADEAEEMGGIAGVWHNQNGTTVTFTNCKFTGTLSANFTEGVDLSNNTLTGKPYSAAGEGQLNIDGVAGVATEKALVEAIKAGKSVILFADIKMTGVVALSNADFVIDGNGFTITQSEACVNTYALFDLTSGKATIKNVTFDGIKGGVVVRNDNRMKCDDRLFRKSCTFPVDNFEMRW